MSFSNPVAVLSRVFAVFLMLFMIASCEKDPCEDAICAACPSSRLMIQYEDSTGACPPAFHANARIWGIDVLTGDTTLNYNFSDSCTAGLLVRENYRYVVMSGTWMNVIDILAFDFQEPVEVTECCLCYPASWVDVAIDGDTTRIDFPTGEYDNSAHTISIN